MIGDAGYMALAEREGFERVTPERVRQVLRPTKPLWILLAIEPIATRLVVVIANRTSITPLFLTLSGFAVSLVAAALFFTGDYVLMAVAALLYQWVFVSDAMDGTLARLKGNGSILALNMDLFLDNWRLFFGVMGLVYGQYRITGSVDFLLWGIAFLTISLVEWQIPRTMAKVHQAYEEYYAPKLGPVDYKVLRLQDWLAKRKLKVIWFNIHERETLVLLVGPLTGLILPMLAVSTALTLVFFGLRIYFDSVLIRQELLSGEKQYLGHTATIYGEVGVESGKET